MNCTTCNIYLSPNTPTHYLGNNWLNFKKIQCQLGYEAVYMYIGGPYPIKIEKAKVEHINYIDDDTILCSDCGSWSNICSSI